MNFASFDYIFTGCYYFQIVPESLNEEILIRLDKIKNKIHFIETDYVKKTIDDYEVPKVINRTRVNGEYNSKMW